MFHGPLYSPDDDESCLQTAADAARRTLVLWAVELRAEGIPQEEAIQLIEQQDLWPFVSPDESRFLKRKKPRPEEAADLVWRLESIWVLLWSLGYINELAWPSGMCDVPVLVNLLKPNEADRSFIENANLRQKSEILDARDLIMRIHWAIRDAYLNGRCVPETLDWRSSDNMVPVNMAHTVGVVEQRHYTLNWLTNYLDPTNWDEVDTPT